MRLLYGHDRDVAAFVQQHIPEARDYGFGNCRAVGVIDEGGRLVAGLVFYNYFPIHGTIEIAGAGITPRWLTRPILREWASYVFDRLGCQLVVMRVSEHNTRLHRQLTAAGFTVTRLERMRGRDEAELVFTLSDDDWKSSKLARSIRGD